MGNSGPFLIEMSREENEGEAMNLDELIARYEAGTEAVFKALGDYNRRDLDSKHPDGWSPRQVVHHLADSETNSYIRLRRLVGEADGTPLPGYDEGAWAVNPTFGYETLPIDQSLELFTAVRRACLATLHRLSPADLLKFGIHSEVGHYGMEHWFSSYTAHPFDHAGQIERAFRGEL
jgi:hypothetical protein